MHQLLRGLLTLGGWLGTAIATVWARGGKLSFAVLITLVVPSIPIGAEMADNGFIAPKTVLTTGIILAATFLASAEKYSYRTLYGLLALTSGLLYQGDSHWAHGAAEHLAGYLLLTTAILHFTERLYWHVVQNRPFPNQAALSNGQ